MERNIFAIWVTLSVFVNAEQNSWSKVSTVVPKLRKESDIESLLSSNFNRNRRITGGVIVSPNSHPYQAALLINFPGASGLCGGSIIKTRTVLTAAHCLQTSTSTLVVLGAHDITKREITQQRQTVQSSNYRTHRQYNPQTFANDIALLILPQAAVFNQFVQPSILPSNFRNELFVGELATSTGWGRTADASWDTSDFLRSTQNNIISNASCRFILGSIIIDSMICVSSAGGRNVCSGDSGGPLTVMRNSKIIQVGIAVFVAGNGCEAGYPGGFTRLTGFLDWIIANSVS